MDDRNRDKVFELLQLAEDQGAMRPWTGIGDIEVIAAGLRLEAAAAARARCSVRRDPVAELRLRPLEMSPGRFRVVPDVLPLSFDEPAHVLLLRRYRANIRQRLRFARSWIANTAFLILAAEIFAANARS